MDKEETQQGEARGKEMLCSQSTGLLQLHIQPCEIGFDPDLLASVAMFFHFMG